MVPHTLSVSPPPAREQGATVLKGPARHRLHPTIAGKAKRNVNEGETQFAGHRQSFKSKPLKTRCIQAMYNHPRVCRYHGLSSQSFCTVSKLNVRVLVHSRSGIESDLEIKTLCFWSSGLSPRRFGATKQCSGTHKISVQLPVSDKISRLSHWRNGATKLCTSTLWFAVHPAFSSWDFSAGLFARDLAHTRSNPIA